MQLRFKVAKFLHFGAEVATDQRDMIVLFEGEERIGGRLTALE